MIRTWTKNIPVEPEALQQIRNLAALPFIHKHVAVMPDVHVGKGATVGSVIPTKKVLIPAAVGVDIGCGMEAVRLSIDAVALPDALTALRSSIEARVPVGRSAHSETPHRASHTTCTWLEKYPELLHNRVDEQIGTLGGGNHFIEICTDNTDGVWVMLHSGSRGQGNNIGRFFIEKAQREMERWHIQLPDKDLAYLPEGSMYYDDYIEAVAWAQDYAALNRRVMMNTVLDTIREYIPHAHPAGHVVSCHHNYISMENHFGENVWVTRKGAVRARKDEWGIIPGSMGTKSYIVQGLGNPDSFCSCSHGAGRVMSRTAARKRISLEEHEQALVGVDCNKTASTLDESPAAYKDIDAVMEAQKDLVVIRHTLKQVMCIKG